LNLAFDEQELNSKLKKNEDEVKIKKLIPSTFESGQAILDRIKDEKNRLKNQKTKLAEDLAVLKETIRDCERNRSEMIDRKNYLY
jgi:hypothetical protein